MNIYPAYNLKRNSSHAKKNHSFNNLKPGRME